MTPRELIPLWLQEDLLPICPCGCESLPAKDYTAVPDYVRRYHARHKWSWLQIERYIIRTGQWEEPPLVHHMRHIRLLMPWMTHDPHLVRLVREGIALKVEGRKVLSMMGHASSGKTNYIVVRGFQSIDLWPEYSEVFVAAPTKVAGQYLLWNEFNKAFGLLKNAGYHVYLRGTVISVNNALSGVGTISFVGLHNVGTMRGKKMLNPNAGELMVAMDEVGEFPNDAMLEILANLKSQRGLQVLTGTNFRHLHGLDGRFHEPKGKEWSDLNRDVDYKWDTTINGVSIRLSAKKSANIVMGTDYYPYLLTKDSHNEMLAYGESSPEYMAQGDAFPCIESVGRNIITTNEIAAAGTYDDVTLDNTERYVFLDPSFTFGGDAAMAVILDVGETKQGDTKLRAVAMERLPVSETTRWDSTLLDLAHKFRKGKALKEGASPGEVVPPFDLCAMLYGKLLLDYAIPFRNAGYDDSMRGTLVHSMVFYLGEAVVPYYYGASADTRLAFPLRTKWVRVQGQRADKVAMTNADLYGKFVSQMWLTSAAIIREGYLRNGFILEGAFTEMKKRLRQIQASKKEDIEPKDEYKKRHHGSPDKADALCGVINMIVEKKLAPKMDNSGFSRNNTEMVLNFITALREDDKPMITALSR